MSNPRLRRLHRRLEQQTYENTDSSITIDAVRDEAAVIILGDPGIGKTTLLQDIAQSAYRTVEQFLVAPCIPPGGTVYLDAFDEYRIHAGARSALQQVASALIELGKPKFVLTCRAADWYGASDQQLIQLASACERVTLLDLLPLLPSEIEDIAEKIVPDVESFLTQAHEAGLSPLLTNPQSLILIAHAWRSERKPNTKTQAYSFGVDELLKESNSNHLPPGKELRLQSLRTAAGAIASTLLLSGRTALSLTEVSPPHCAGLADVPFPDNLVATAVLKRRVFRAIGDRQYVPIHRTVAEYLGAEELARRIKNGLSIERVLTLMSGADGKPASSMRGLYAWLMVHLGDRAAPYIGLDPYAAAAYGDAISLSPQVQNALWRSLKTLDHLWYEKGALRGLANRSTAKELVRIISDRLLSVDSRAVALEAMISAATALPGSVAALKRIVVNHREVRRLRELALNALIASKCGSHVFDSIDRKLRSRRCDPRATDLRLQVLLQSPLQMQAAERTLSILEQITYSDRPEAGRFLSLASRLPDTVAQTILNGVDGRIEVVFVPPPDEIMIFTLPEIRYPIEILTFRQLRGNAPLDPANVTQWLRFLPFSDSNHRLQDALKDRLARNPRLLPDILSCLVSKSGQWPNARPADLLVKLVPPACWPISPARFFLECAIACPDAVRAAECFANYVKFFPAGDQAPALARAGFDFARERAEVICHVPTWNIQEIHPQRLDYYRAAAEREERLERERVANIAYLQPILATVESAGDARALRIATTAYLYPRREGARGTPMSRLIAVSNTAIAVSLMKGLVSYLCLGAVPTAEDVMDAWCKNEYSIDRDTVLVSLHRRSARGLDIPAAATATCIAAAATWQNDSSCTSINEYFDTWFLAQAKQNRAVVERVLPRLWSKPFSTMPRLDTLLKKPSHIGLLVKVAAEVLRAPRPDYQAAFSLMPILWSNAPMTCEELARERLVDCSMSAEFQAIWVTAAYLVNPQEWRRRFTRLADGPAAAVLATLALLRGAHHNQRLPALSAHQAFDCIRLIGGSRRQISPPDESLRSEIQRLDAELFIDDQIRQLASCSSPEALQLLQRLQHDTALAFCRERIFRCKSDLEKQLREVSYCVPDLDSVRKTLSNEAPASAADLLCYVADHLAELSCELAGTQKERFRAYWNENDRTLLRPKREEICSGLLAEDLQQRIRAHGLIVDLEHHLVDERSCDIVVLQGTTRLLPIEIKHHYHVDLWTAWRTQLQRLYLREAHSGGFGIYLVLWSGLLAGRRPPSPPSPLVRPTSAAALRSCLLRLIPDRDKSRIRVVVVDIEPPRSKDNPRRARKMIATRSTAGGRPGQRM